MGRGVLLAPVHVFTYSVVSILLSEIKVKLWPGVSRLEDFYKVVLGEGAGQSAFVFV